jgi:hypothetical protein
METSFRFLIQFFMVKDLLSLDADAQTGTFHGV